MLNQAQQSAYNPLIIQLVILLEGFVTISFEILTIRQLIPVVGNSVIVTSLIIGVFLLFLAYGYRKGGIYVERFISILKFNFTLAAIGIGIGLSYGFISGFFIIGAKLLGGNFLITLIIYLLLVTAPLVYLLGQTVPITLNLYKQQQTVGAIGGKVLHISTIGSFLGAVLTSLILMNYVGVAWTIFANYVVLGVLVVLLSERSRDAIQLVTIVMMGIVIYLINIQWENRVFVRTNSYANYQIINTSIGKILEINNSPSSLLGEKSAGFPYIEYIKKVLFQDLKLQNKIILVLGAGGFSLSAEGTHNNHFIYVDIDPKIKSIVEQNFLANIKGNFVAEDAREFLNKTTEKYDVIVSDTYSNQIAIPAHLLTQEYFAAIDQALKPEGIAIFNIIAKPTLSDAYSKRIDNTIRTIFKNCMVAPLQYTLQPTNIIYVCTKVNSENDMVIYSDNLNRATLDYFKAN